MCIVTETVILLIGRLLDCANNIKANIKSLIIEHVTQWMCKIAELNLLKLETLSFFVLTEMTDRHTSNVNFETIVFYTTLPEGCEIMGLMNWKDVVVFMYSSNLHFKAGFMTTN